MFRHAAEMEDERAITEGVQSLHPSSLVTRVPDE